MKSTESTTIRINKSTKGLLDNLDFVRKDTYDDIIIKLMDYYKRKKG